MSKNIKNKASATTVREPLFHVVKRAPMPVWQAMLIRVIAIVAAFLLCTMLSSLLIGKTPVQFLSTFFKGTIGSSRRIWNLAKDAAKLLCISLAVTPAFRMRFWNIGAEGQTIIGALGAVSIIFYFGGKLPEWLLLILMLVAAIVAGAIWGVIPAIFKSKWQTNETLFTLMMNYIAMQIVSYFANISCFISS